MQPPLKTLHAMCVRIDRCTTCVGDLELDGPRCAAVITTRKNVLVASVLGRFVLGTRICLCSVRLAIVVPRDETRNDAIQCILCSFDTYAKPTSSFFFRPSFSMIYNKFIPEC